MEDIDKRLFHRLLLYKARGKIDDQEGEVFSHQHWQAILMGLGYEPQDFDPLAMNVDQKFMVQELEKIKQTLYRAACQLPTLNEYLAINKQ